MNFEQFAGLHGIRVGAIVPGRWMRFPTDDKPRNRNGAVKYMGDWGLAQNWATMEAPAIWRAEGENQAAIQRVREVAKQAEAMTAQAATKAAQRAETMLAECELMQHQYLASKGFPDAMANVWRAEDQNILCIPMRSAGAIVGMQMISPDGDKKFLYGQRSGGAEFVIGRAGQHVLCEGYATGLSVQRALSSMKLSAVIHITFSAGNMKRIASGLGGGFVVADNDESGTGQRVAAEIGWPFWISDRTGEDANDYCQRGGVFKLAMGLKKLFLEARRM